MYWRTYLLCPKQDGSQGESLVISNERILPPPAGSKPKFFYDFTSVAEALGWHRIRAQQGFEKVSTKKEFWHYQLTEGYTFDEAIELLYGDRAKVKTQPEFPTLKAGDHDNDQEVNVRRDVRQLQAQLYLLKFLAPLAEVDGGYFGGYVKPANHVENRRDRRLRQYQSGKRKTWSSSENERQDTAWRVRLRSRCA